MNIQLYLFTIVIFQIILMKLFQMSYFDIFSLIKNVLFGILILVVFFKLKKSHNILWNLRKYYKNYSLLLIIPFVYVFQYIFVPTYIGQDIYKYKNLVSNTGIMHTVNAS
jgi:hypothetical protein